MEEAVFEEMLQHEYAFDVVRQHIDDYTKENTPRWYQFWRHEKPNFVSYSIIMTGQEHDRYVSKLHNDDFYHSFHLYMKLKENGITPKTYHTHTRFDFNLDEIESEGALYEDTEKIEVLWNATKESGIINAIDYAHILHDGDDTTVRFELSAKHVHPETAEKIKAFYENGGFEPELSERCMKKYEEPERLNLKDSILTGYILEMSL